MLNDCLVVATYNASRNYEERPLPDFYEVRAKFDAALTEEPSTVPTSIADLEQLELRQALGVA